MRFFTMGYQVRMMVVAARALGLESSYLITFFICRVDGFRH
jgi:hypothetical protein